MELDGGFVMDGMTKLGGSSSWAMVVFGRLEISAGAAVCRGL